MSGEVREDAKLEELLIRHRDRLLAIVRRTGRGLLRFEESGDLVQEIHVRALGSKAVFEFRSDGEFMGWISTLAERHIADRHRYWRAEKRKAGQLLRITAHGGSTSGVRGVEPEGKLEGATTFAVRRERLVLATRVVAAMLPRDQELIQMISDGVSIQETADELGLSYDAAERARNRAVKRFREAFGALGGRA